MTETEKTERTEQTEQTEQAEGANAAEAAATELALALIAAAIDPARPLPRATEGELLSAYRLAKRHDLGHLVAHVILREALFPKESPLLSKLEQVRFTAVYRAERMAHEIGRVKAALRDAKIPHIPLKGAVLRELYPENWMRTSSDFDVLVPKGDFDRAVDALVSQGYAAGQRGGHDVVLKREGGCPVELHFSLMEDGISGTVSEPLARIWDYAVPVAEGAWEHRLDGGAFYYYHTAHMAKHVLHGGCGIRPFLDLWIMRGHMAKDGALLKEGGLLPLSLAAESLADAWFFGGEKTPTLRRLERFVLAGGVYGTIENRVVASKGKKGGRLGYILSRLFLPYATLKEFFPILERHKWLTPLYQAVRWWRMIREGRMHRTRRELAATKEADPAAVRDAALLMEELSL